jgi:hypothetical protein
LTKRSATSRRPQRLANNMAGHVHEMAVGVQYEYKGHTMTLAREVYIGEPLTTGLFEEIDGKKPMIGDIAPDPVLSMLYALAWGISFEDCERLRRTIT